MNKFVLVILIAIVTLGMLRLGVHVRSLGPNAQVHSGKVLGYTPGAQHLQKDVVRLRSATTQQTKLDNIQVPWGMVKNGKLQKLSEQQQQNFVILASFFHNDLTMVKIAACEASLLHTFSGGGLRISDDGEDHGMYQIRVRVHGDVLSRFGLNVADFAHNVAFAAHLRKLYGYRPWESTRDCWENLEFVWRHETQGTFKAAGTPAGGFFYVYGQNNITLYSEFTLTLEVCYEKAHPRRNRGERCRGAGSLARSFTPRGAALDWEATQGRSQA